MKMKKSKTLIVLNAIVATVGSVFGLSNANAYNCTGNFKRTHFDGTVSYHMFSLACQDRSYIAQSCFCTTAPNYAGAPMGTWTETVSCTGAFLSGSEPSTWHVYETVSQSVSARRDELISCNKSSISF